MSSKHSRKRGKWVPPNPARIAKAAEPTAADRRRAYILEKVRLTQHRDGVEAEAARLALEVTNAVAIIHAQAARIARAMDRADVVDRNLAAVRSALKNHVHGGKRFEFLRAEAEVERLAEEIRREEGRSDRA